MRKILALTSLATGLLFAAGAALADCGPISIAEMKWASAGIAAQVDKIILEEGYDCRVQLVSGDTMPTFSSMNERGEPDLAPEFWVNSDRAELERASREGRLIIGAEILSDGAVEGWWIPKFVADANPGLRTVQQALDRPELFPHPTEPSKAAVVNCPSGWSCEVSTANLFKALGAANKGFELVETTSADELDASIANAFQNKKGWLGYYWAPTAILGKYEMVKLSFDVPHDKVEWDTCTAVRGCGHPEVNSYPTSRAFTLATKRFSEEAAAAMDYINKRQWTNAAVNSILAWQLDNQATNQDAARYFLKTMPDIWRKWVSPEVADKVTASL